LPGRTDGSPGIGGYGKSNVNNIGIKSTAGSPFPDGTYVASFVGDEGKHSPLMYDYTAIAPANAMNVVDTSGGAGGVDLDGTPWTDTATLGGIQSGLDHTLNWDHLTSGGLNNLGAGKYHVLLRDKFGDDVNEVGAEQLRHITLSSECSVISARCSWIIQAGVLEAGASYCLKFQARDEANSRNRSISRDLCLDTAIDGDFNADGVVNSLDIGIMMSNWGSSDPLTDLSGNGVVGTEDLAELVGYL